MDTALNAQNYDGNTPLHLAFMNITNNRWENYFKIIKLLVDAGADLNIRNNNNQTPLDIFILNSKDYPTEKWRRQVLSYTISKMPNFK